SGGAWCRQAASSVAPISTDMDAPCVLPWRLQSLARNARPSLNGALADAAVTVARPLFPARSHDRARHRYRVRLLRGAGDEGGSAPRAAARDATARPASAESY